MKQQRKSAKAGAKTSDWHIVWKNYRKQSTATIILLVLLLAVGGFKLNSYLNKFSDRDFAAIEQAAENVMRSVGVEDVAKNKFCSYEAPDKYSSKSLYCRIQMAGYFPYQSDDNARETVQKLEREINLLGTMHSYMSDFYDNPRDRLSSASVKMKSPLPDRQCNFTISSNETAKRATSFLPEKDDDNLIAINFECGAESREEYFKVIDG